MKFSELNPDFCRDKIFTCKPSFKKLEVDVEDKMKGKIVSVSPCDEDVLRVEFCTADFVDHNNFYASYNYFDKNGIPRLTAREANCWPKDEKHSIYFAADDVVEDYFEFDNK